MNREQANKFLPLITAFAEGKEIEFWSETERKWFTSDNPRWQLGLVYRIKPEPVVVEKWAAVNHADGSIRMFDTERAAREFVSVGLSAGLSGLRYAFMMRGTYER